MDDKQFIERTNRRYRHPAPAPGRGGRADDLMPSQLADTMTDEDFQRRLEHKYGHRWVRMPNGEPATTGQRSSEGKAKVQGGDRKTSSLATPTPRRLCGVGLGFSCRCEACGLPSGIRPRMKWLATFD